MGSGLAVRHFLSGVIKICMIARPDTSIAAHCSPARQTATSHGGDIQLGVSGLGQVSVGCDDGQHDPGPVDAPLHDAEVTGQAPQAQRGVLHAWSSTLRRHCQ